MLAGTLALRTSTISGTRELIDFALSHTKSGALPRRESNPVPRSPKADVIPLYCSGAKPLAVQVGPLLHPRFCDTGHSEHSPRRVLCLIRTGWSIPSREKLFIEPWRRPLRPVE